MHQLLPMWISHHAMQIRFPYILITLCPLTAPDLADIAPVPDSADIAPVPDLADIAPAPDSADTAPALDNTGSHPADSALDNNHHHHPYSLACD
jgi:hypothetical protein